jgi:hypothetical protein
MGPDDVIEFTFDNLADATLLSCVGPDRGQVCFAFSGAASRKLGYTRSSAWLV